MALVAILTPDPESPAMNSRWFQIFEQLRAPLEAKGLEVEGPAWTDTGDLSRFAAAMPLAVWGYHLAGEHWLQQTGRWEEQGAPVHNAPAVLRWNADKSYIARLGARGAPVPPTIYSDRLSEKVLEEAAVQFGTDRLVAKPRISANAFQTVRWSRGEPLVGGPEGEAMIQPYLPLIETDGEISLIFLAGAFSHAIRKVPRRGDFRVQPEYHSNIEAARPDREELAAAEAALAAVGEDLLYARVDLVRDLAGKPVLMEIELVEPDLYLGFCPKAPEAFADAVLQLI